MAGDARAGLLWAEASPLPFPILSALRPIHRIAGTDPPLIFLVWDRDTVGEFRSAAAWTQDFTALDSSPKGNRCYPPGNFRISHHGDDPAAAQAARPRR